MSDTLAVQAIYALTAQVEKTGQALCLSIFVLSLVIIMFAPRSSR